ncbi:anti-sigma factor RsiW [Nocardioides marinisabuli]|uniref:Anti-sigma factor RsiW n=1 Tax=Nocardioides marinisabuli TaxID=419476 RepID=A0A7Y9JQE1_9ACTN|nr:zf-HC2 domain-containing protein [Nocardioides marinisabuli]NYD57982.1 anti-sigma factor RsiW [Nocardioides marinisabuli]
MIGHLGTRASALLDGRLGPDEADRLWEHVHGCHQCRDLVERLGAVKTRLGGLGAAPCAGAPDHLKGALKSGLAPGFPAAGPGPASAPALTPGEVYLALGDRPTGRARRAGGVVATVGSAAGVAVLGLLALGAAPADAPTADRQVPVTSVTVPSYGPGVVPVRGVVGP